MPSSFNNKQSAWQKLKSKNINRSSVLTVLSLVIALVIVIAAAVATNRSKQPTEVPISTDSAQTDKSPNKPDSTEPENTEPDNTEKDTSKPSSSQVGNKLPSFELPVSGTLSGKHGPDLQVFSPTMNDYRVHLGIDLVTKENASVYSAADGTVSKIWVDPLMGYCMAIEHSGDCVTIYKNLSETLPSGIVEGAAVRTGQLIASVGNSAMVEIADEPHLHFEMTVGDLAVDPLEYFDEEALETIKTDTTHGE